MPRRGRQAGQFKIVLGTQSVQDKPRLCGAFLKKKKKCVHVCVCGRTLRLFYFKIVELLL